MRRYRRPILVVLLAITCLVALIAYDRSVERSADAVEWGVARMPLGTSGAEAERRIGRPPDRVTQEMGVIAYSAMLLTASNSLAAEYGKPQMYDVRIWYVGPVTVCVYTDQNDRVALRTAQRPPRRPSIADRLRRFLQNLL